MTTVPYNLTNLTNSTDLYQHAIAMNDLSGQLLMISLYFVIYILLFIIFREQGMRVALTGVSFIVSIIGTIMWFLRFIPGWVLIIPIVVTVLSIVGLYAFNE